MLVKIDITQQDIDNGEQLDPFLCVVAKAINRVLKPGLGTVLTDCIRIVKDNGQIVEWIFDKNLMSYAHKFDREKESCKPETFLVNFEEDVVKEI